MARRPATFRQADLTRALKAALQAGLTVVGTMLHPDGRIELSYANAEGVPRSPPKNDWD